MAPGTSNGLTAAKGELEPVKKLWWAGTINEARSRAKLCSPGVGWNSLTITSLQSKSGDDVLALARQHYAPNP